MRPTARNEASHSVRPATRACAATVLLFAAAWLAGCGARPHAAPANPVAEGAANEVQLTWNAATDADSYEIRWENSDTDTEPFPNVIRDVKETSFLHTGLTNFQTYRYQIFARGKGGTGPGSVIVSAEPGPVPDTVTWTAVAIDDLDHVIHFEEAAGADIYRVYFGSDPSALAGRRPRAFFVEADASPLVRQNIGVNVGLYYRVIGTAGSRIGFDGPVVHSAAFAIGEYEDLPEITPALADWNADDCLDAVGAEGDCSGNFAAVDLAAAGLDGLFAAGRTPGDARFADVNADGRPDVFGDVLAPAGEAVSRAMLLLNQGNGTFAEDASVGALGIGGFGGTVLAADFDNDGDVDLFAPHDWTGTDGGRNWLLVNADGTGFSDAAAAAGLQTGPTGAAYKPAGGQAVDFDEDGWVDILFGSRLMRNDGDGTFSDVSAAVGLAAAADQGLALADVDLDGDLDLVRHDGTFTRLYRNTGGVFGAGEILQGDAARTGAGLAVCDLTGDGFEDILVASNDVATGTGTPRLLVNVDGQFVPSTIPDETALDTGDLVDFNDLLACADTNGDGTVDVFARWGTYRSLVGRLGNPSTIRIRVLGGGGEFNQQGRIVRIVPAGAPGRTLMRVVESGSGLRAQGDYDVLVPAPWPGEYAVSVRFASGWIDATAEAGDRLTIYADGRTEK